MANNPFDFLDSAKDFWKAGARGAKIGMRVSREMAARREGDRIEQEFGEEVADAVAWLVSTGSAAITGQAIAVALGETA